MLVTLNSMKIFFSFPFFNDEKKICINGATNDEWMNKNINRKIGFLFTILATNFYLLFFPKFICHFVQKKRKIFVIAFIIIIIWNWPSKLIIIIIINSLKSLTKKKKKISSFLQGDFFSIWQFKKKIHFDKWMDEEYLFIHTDNDDDDVDNDNDNEEVIFFFTTKIIQYWMRL